MALICYEMRAHWMQCNYLGKILTIYIGNENEISFVKHIRRPHIIFDNIDILHRSCSNYEPIILYDDDLLKPFEQIRQREQKKRRTIIERIGLQLR